MVLELLVEKLIDSNSVFHVLFWFFFFLFFFFLYFLIFLILCSIGNSIFSPRNGKFCVSSALKATNLDIRTFVSWRLGLIPCGDFFCSFRTAPYEEKRNLIFFFEKRGPQCSLSLSDSLSVCSRPVGHSFWPRGLIIGINDPKGNHSKFFFFWFVFLYFEIWPTYGYF